MNRDILQHFDKKTGVSDIVGLLADGLSGSELSSLLLAVYERKVGKMKATELLAQYRGNRLVQPADVDMVAVLEAEVLALRYLRDRWFAPLALSPVAALGSCSLVASVSQDKVVSAVRNTEIVADATNVIALHAADRRKSGEMGEMRFCTVHRHLRTQPLMDKRHRSHFVIGCMVTAGRDIGSYAFECAGLVEHVGSLVGLLRDGFGVSGFRLVLKRRGGYPDAFFARAEESLRAVGVEIRCEEPSAAKGPNGSGRAAKDLNETDRVEAGPRSPKRDRSFDEVPAENAYYRGVQFKLYILVGGEEREIADGGFVDWTQRLLENKKERMLISGFGLELLYRFKML